MKNKNTRSENYLIEMAAERAWDLDREGLECAAETLKREGAITNIEFLVLVDFIDRSNLVETDMFSFSI